AGHGDIGAGGLVEHERGEAREHRGAGAGAVLGDRAGGDVDVDVALGEELGVDAHLLGAGANERVGGGGGFLHDVADLTGEGDGFAAGHAAGFDEEELPTDGRVVNAGGDA